MPNLLKNYLPIVLPLIIVPIVMKFIITPIIKWKLQKKYLNILTSTIKEGWVDERDIEAIEYLKNSAWKGFNSPFVISYNFKSLKKQAIEIFINISQIYNGGETINLQFSIQKIMESLYLLFEDLHKDLKHLKPFKIIEKLPLNVLLKMNSINSVIKILTKHKILQIFKKYRISAKFMQILLIPIFGVPILIYQLLFSLFYSTILEGYIRFIYGLILLKAGYYSIYLYSDRNSSLHNRINFSHRDIIARGELIEKIHTSFSNRDINSDRLEASLGTFKSKMEELKILPSRECSLTNSTLKRTFNRVANSVKKAIDRELTNKKSTKIFSIRELVDITEAVSKVYYNDSKRPFFQLRIKEFLELGYFVTTVSLKSIYSLPGFKNSLDKIPIKLIIDLKELIDMEKIKKYLPHLKNGTKTVANINKYYTASKLILKKGSPITFAISLISPIVFQQVLDSFKEYTYNLYGLLLIDSFEASILKSNLCRIENLE